MVRGNRLIFAVVCLVLLALTGCQLTSNLVELPLTDTEALLVGHWQHVHGVGNVWNWEFFEQDRSAHHFTTNLIWGDTSEYLHWAATDTEIIIYERDKLLVTERTRYAYSLTQVDLLLMGDVEYELQ